jgi:phosphoribosylanthranilate isomerase
MIPALCPRGRTAIKLCGLTNIEDVTWAFDAGADAAGVILAPSPRRVSLETAVKIAAACERPQLLVAVVGDDVSAVPQLCAAGFTMQFCAPITTEKAAELTGGAPYLRVVHVAASAAATSLQRTFAACEMPLFDTAAGGFMGGSGRSFPWERVAGIAARRAIVVAGGLTASNVGACIRSLRPAAVDVCSGIETLGSKSAEKMRAFVRAVREADVEIYAA